MNPYEARPDKIPEGDRYIAEPFYGRYHPLPDDFRPDSQHVMSDSPGALAYWASVVQRCDFSTRLYENNFGGRDVFAVGTVIVKSSHLHSAASRSEERDYSFADRNEVAATALAREVLPRSVKVPAIYFADKIDGLNVLVQERVPGVGLNVAWQYLTAAQKASFKEQARALLHELCKARPPPGHKGRSYLFEDPDPVQHKGIQEAEKNILFSDDAVDDLAFMHNDFTQSNCIVNDDKIVGLVDWEMAGYFGWKTAGEVHVEIRSPRRENFTSLNLAEDFLADILYWNDLYRS
ncbi:phd transcription factor [Ophiostoma piceae UAMH 11346]|uniref:Phd transcription factor n=1 Tax=Ophiostoma piceae (strain UAMH 11346) TaxID=1262450 RepID=S3BXY8_OPHP1|nr:phd transcription factor [Ophiostoma piceae UAMH 11346]